MNWKNTMKRMLCLTLLGGLLAGPSLLGAEEKELPTLDEQMQAAAGKVLEFLASDKTLPDKPNVGVLKFLVRKGKGPATDNAGPLNGRLAERLEVALVLALKKESIRLLENTGETLVKAKNKGATHLTQEGRRKFFNTRFEPAWGDKETVEAHAFLTGEVDFERYDHGVLVIQAFTAKNPRLSEVGRFPFRPNTETLSEAGVSFAVPRGISREDLRQKFASIVEKPREVLDKSPVKLEILYNGKAVAPDQDGNVKEPEPGTRVSFRVTHRNLDDQTYGVVLKINGQNTVFPNEREPADLHCCKWLLGPKQSYEISAFQKTEEDARQFTVAPLTPRERDMVRYDQHLGTYALTIFRAAARPEKEDLPKPKEEEIIQKAISRGSLAAARGDSPSDRPETFKQLQGKLRSSTGASSAGKARGVIRQGTEVKSVVKAVPFRADPVPVLSLTLRYAKPEE
jgi:hypothetical protein